MKNNFFSYIIATAIALIIGYSAIQYLGNHAKELMNNTVNKIAE